jgi:hypothetical protein
MARCTASTVVVRLPGRPHVRRSWALRNQGEPPLAVRCRRDSEPPVVSGQVDVSCARSWKTSCQLWVESRAQLTTRFRDPGGTHINLGPQRDPARSCSAVARAPGTRTGTGTGTAAAPTWTPHRTPDPGAGPRIPKPEIRNPEPDADPGRRPPAPRPRHPGLGVVVAAAERQGHPRARRPQDRPQDRRKTGRKTAGRAPQDGPQERPMPAKPRPAPRRRQDRGRSRQHHDRLAPDI